MIKKYGQESLACLIALLVIYANYIYPPNPLFTEKEKILITSLSPIEGKENTIHSGDSMKTKLGKALFFETGFSENGQISCASCHNPEKSWTDGLQISVGLDTGSRNTMSLWNIKDNRWFFWDGRADSKWSQALKPIESPKEMGSSRLAVYHFVNENEEYSRLYKSAFGLSPHFGEDSHFPLEGYPGSSKPEWKKNWDKLNQNEKDFINGFFVNVGKSIEAFENQIVSYNSRFDRFVVGLKKGDEVLMSELDESEIRGLRLFIKARCISCHNGPNFTDMEFHDIRLAQLRTPPDSGRLAGISILRKDPFNLNSKLVNSVAENLTQYLSDRPQNFGEFKTPSLRNVTLTAPYMHDGRFESLQQVLEHYNTLLNATEPDEMAETLIQPLFLTKAEIQDLLNFLSTLEDNNLEFLND